MPYIHPGSIISRRTRRRTYEKWKFHYEPWADAIQIINIGSSKDHLIIHSIIYGVLCQVSSDLNEAIARFWPREPQFELVFEGETNGQEHIQLLVHCSSSESTIMLPYFSWPCLGGFGWGSVSQPVLLMFSPLIYTSIPSIRDCIQLFRGNQLIFMHDGSYRKQTPIPSRFDSPQGIWLCSFRACPSDQPMWLWLTMAAYLTLRRPVRKSVITSIN